MKFAKWWSSPPPVLTRREYAQIVRRELGREERKALRSVISGAEKPKRGRVASVAAEYARQQMRLFSRILPLIVFITVVDFAILVWLGATAPEQAGQFVPSFGLLLGGLAVNAVFVYRRRRTLAKVEPVADDKALRRMAQKASKRA